MADEKDKKEVQRGESTGRAKLSDSAFIGGHDCDHAAGPIAWRRIRSRKNKRVHRDALPPRPMRFVSLHHHSTFSYLDGYQMPSAHVRRAEEINMGAIALTEHGNVSSHVKLEIASQDSGVKPIYGVELYTGEIEEESRTQIKNHLTILARDVPGYQNLIRLVSETYSRGFYYEPTADAEMLDRYADGLYVLSGCAGSELFTACIGGKHVDPGEASRKRGLEVARRFRTRFGDRYFIEVQAFPELRDKTCIANPILASIADELKIPLVATMDCHYTQLTESEMQQVLHNVRGGGRKTLEEQAQDWGYDVPLCPPPNDASIVRRLVATGLSRKQALEAVANTALIADDCNVELPKLPMLRYPAEEGLSSVELFRKWIGDGWTFRGIDRLPPRERAAYRARLRKEVGIILEKDFQDYFLVVSDVVRWTKDNGIAVGPARGSAAASLVCYLLRITEVNPMLFPNLVFERFIDITREDLPDIDLDFDSDRRHEVREYLVSKYGAECVSNIGTFSTYKAKMALDDTARAFRIPQFEVERVKDLLLERSSGDLRASATIEDTAQQFDVARDVFERFPDLGLAMDLEGNVKGFGVHAAGLVVSNGPITDVCAVYGREVKGRPVDVISYDKYDAERQGLIKMDLLGLSTMAMVALSLDWLGLDIQDMYDLALDDEKVIDGFRRGDVTGVFQFDGRATRSINGFVKPDNFQELCDINALSRPGPLHNGSASAYVDIKWGREKVEKIHPAYDAITSNTYSQLVYQEQILRVVREIGNFSWTHAAYIRRIISRKLGEHEFNRQRDIFLAGAKELHGDTMSEEMAVAIWNDCITAGAYAFNYAHCVAYGMLAYWTMWIKVYHPEVFFAASLAKLPEARAYEIMRDAHKHGIEVSPPTVDSDRSWSPGVGRIYSGLTQIKGIGDRVSGMMIEYREERAREDRPISEWRDYREVRGIGPKTIASIEEFCSLEDPFEILLTDKLLAATRRMCEESPLPSPTHTNADIEALPTGKTIPIVWAGTIRTRNLRDIFEVNAKKGKEIDPATIRDPHLHESMAMQGWDGEAQTIPILVNRWRYPFYREELWKVRLDRDILLVRGNRPHWGPMFVVAEDLWVLRPEDLEEWMEG